MFSILRRAGYAVSLGSRSYHPRLDDPQLDATLIRAQEIPRYVQEGVFDCGVTGYDWVAETEAQVVNLCELVSTEPGFRQIRWVLAVNHDSPVQTPADLAGRKVATELVNCTRRYFAERGVAAQVEYSWGATEAKVPRLVDAIVDVTETGSTLRAHNLRVVDTVITSTTRLIANPNAHQDEWKRHKMENLVTLLQGAILAEVMVGLKMNVAREDVEAVLNLLPAMRNPTISSLADERYVALEVVATEAVVRDLVPALKRAGATAIIEYPLNKVIP